MADDVVESVVIWDRWSPLPQCIQAILNTIRHQVHGNSRYLISVCVCVCVCMNVSVRACVCVCVCDARKCHGFDAKTHCCGGTSVAKTFPISFDRPIKNIVENRFWQISCPMGSGTNSAINRFTSPATVASLSLCMYVDANKTITMLFCVRLLPPQATIWS